MLIFYILEKILYNKKRYKLFCLDFTFRKENQIMDLFKRICSDIREDVKKASNRDILSIEKETPRFITIFDYMDEVDRFYTINNPKYMDRKFLQDKLVITNSVKRSRKYHIDTTKMLDWLYKNLPKEMWMTLNKIVIINKDEDFDELYQKEDFSDLLEAHELPDDDNDLLGITWFSEDIVVISLKNIIKLVSCNLNILYNSKEMCNY